MLFQPEILSPTPDPDFVRQLRLIDKDLRVNWAYIRYLRREWAIERVIEDERYYRMYRSILDSNGPKVIQQPLFSADDPILNEEGQKIGYQQIGSRPYDLAPRNEHLFFSATLDEALLTKIKRVYAWNVNHPFSRERYEAEEQAKKDEKKKDWSRRFDDSTDQAVDQAFAETRKKVHFGAGTKTRKEFA